MVVVGAGEALGKRAKTVSALDRNDLKERARGAGRGKRRKHIFLEKDQPLHVQLRVARMRQFQMQDTAARLAGDHYGRDNRMHQDRVAHCLRRLTDVASGVECRYNPAGHSGHFRGLQTCGSVWHCPVCAAKISEKRRDQLALLVSRHVAAGGSVWMTTYTVSHKKCTDLADLVTNFLAARRKMRQGRRGVALRRDFGVVGTVSVLEVTYSERNGWHPHVHELVFSDQAAMSPDGYDQAARSAWQDAAGSLGLQMNDHGFKIDRTFGAVQDYITKFGHEPASKPWGTESEMTKGHIKKSRSEDGMTPFGLLAAITDGLAEYEPLWREYARCFKGRKQLNFSPGLKERYGLKDKEDAELAAESEGDPHVTLVDLSPAQWDQVVEAKARSGLYELIRTGRPGAIIAGLAEIGIEAVAPDMAGWRVRGPDGPGEVELVRADKYADGDWRVWVLLDGPGGRIERVRMYALWDIEVLSGAIAPANSSSAGPANNETLSQLHNSGITDRHSDVAATSSDVSRSHGLESCDYMQTALAI